MKVTWFSGTALRVHIGGSILLFDSSAATGVNRLELESAADAIIQLSDPLEQLDFVAWTPPRAPSPLDEEVEVAVEVFGVPGGVLVSAAGEPPLIILNSQPQRAGRWSRDAIAVLLDEDAGTLFKAVLDALSPTMILIPEAFAQALDFSALAAECSGTAVQVLESRLGVEIG